MMMLLLINDEFMIYVIWMLLGTCCWWESMNLMMIIVKFGLNCDVLMFLVKNECGEENLLIWCYELMFWFTLISFWCMLTVGEGCTTFLGQLGF